MYEKIRSLINEFKYEKNIIDVLKNSTDYCFVNYQIENKEQYFTRVLERFDKIKEFDNINSLEKFIKDKYSISYDSEFKTELSKFVYFISYLCSNLIINKNLLYFLKSDTEFLTTTFIRLQLIKANWSCKSIEKFISNKFRQYVIDENFCNITYIFIYNILNYTKDYMEKGRPKIPLVVKQLCIPYNKQENKMRMNKIYSFYKTLDKTDLYYLLNSEAVKNNITLYNKILKLINIKNS